MRLPGDVRDRQVLLDDALARVDEDERDVGALGRLERAQLRVVLDPLPLLALAADARGVDEDERPLAALGARCRSSRGSFPAARRRSPAPRRETRSAGSTCRRSAARGSRRGSPPRPPRPGRSPGSRATIASSRSPVPWPCTDGDGNRVAEPEPVELERLGLAPGLVDLVRDQEDRLARVTQDRGELLVAGRDPGPRVDDEQDEVGLGDRACAPARRPASSAATGRRCRRRPCRRAGSGARPTRRRPPCGRA